MNSSTPTFPRIFYGWYVVATLTIVGGVAYGAGVYAFTLFMSPLANEFGWGRGVISGSIALFWLSAPLVPFIGTFCDKIGAMRLIILGAVIEGTCLVLIGFIDQLWALYLLRVAMGIGKIIMVVPIPIILCKWFCDRYSTALGISIAGWHIGGLLLAPFTQYLIDTFSWRLAAFSLGGLFFVTIIPMALMILRIAEPAALGLAPDGLKLTSDNEAKAREKIEEIQSGDSFSSVLKNWFFWAIVALTAVYYAGYLGALTQAPAYFSDIGIDAMVGASALGAIAAFAAVSVILFGILVEKFSIKSTLLFVFALFGVSLVLLNWVGIFAGVAFLYLFALVFGLAVGAGDVIWMTLLRRSFGNKNYGSIFGVWYFIALVAMFAGPIIGGYIYDVSGSYQAPLQAITISAFLCLFVACFLPLQRRPTIN